jgi:hypothetical protein
LAHKRQIRLFVPVMGMADGYAQATRGPAALVNHHTGGPVKLARCPKDGVTGEQA